MPPLPLSVTICQVEDFYTFTIMSHIENTAKMNNNVIASFTLSTILLRTCGQLCELRCTLLFIIRFISFNLATVITIIFLALGYLILNLELGEESNLTVILSSLTAVQRQ